MRKAREVGAGRIRRAMPFVLAIAVGLAGLTEFAAGRSGAAQAAEITAAELAALDILPQSDGNLFDHSGLPPVERDAPGAGDVPLGDDVVSSPPAASEPLPAWRRYAALSNETGKGPLIAIVIDDLGHAERHLVPALAIDAPLTLAFLPYPEMTRQLASRARAAGYELLVHMPMEPGNPEADPGPGALMATLDEDELRATLRQNLDALDGYVGINNHMGSKFTQDARAMQIIMEELASRGLLYLDSITTHATQGWREAEKLRIPYAKRDIFLDNLPTLEAVGAQLEFLEARAREFGYAVAIGHPYAATFESIAQWLPEARARGIEIVPLSTISALECAC